MPNYITDNIPFSDRYMFAKVMGDNPGFCKRLAEIILGKELLLDTSGTEVTITQVTKASIRLDLLILASKEIIVIEMQASPERHIAKRARRYRSLVDSRALDKGQSIDGLPDSYVIFICKQDPFRRGLPRYTAKRTVEEDSTIPYDTGSTDITLNASADLSDLSPELIHLLHYVATQEVDESDEFIVALDTAVKQTLADETWRAEVEAYNQDFIDKYSEGHIDGLEEGVMLGREQGLEEGMTLGLEQGLAQGVAQGAKAGRIEMIESLVSQGLLTQEQAAQQIERLEQKA